MLSDVSRGSAGQWGIAGTSRALAATYLSPRGCVQRSALIVVARVHVRASPDQQFHDLAGERGVQQRLSLRAPDTASAGRSTHVRPKRRSLTVLMQRASTSALSSNFRPFSADTTCGSSMQRAV